MSILLKLPFYLFAAVLIVLAGWLLPLLLIQPKRIDLPRC